MNFSVFVDMTDAIYISNKTPTYSDKNQVSNFQLTIFEFDWQYALSVLISYLNLRFSNLVSPKIITETFIKIMPCWYWDKKDLDNCPSRLTGVPAETVQRYRKEGAKFIYKLGQVQALKLLSIGSDFFLIFCKSLLIRFSFYTTQIRT